MNEEQINEIAIVNRILMGEHELFRILVERYERRLILYLKQMLGDYDRARDIAQDAFVSAYQSLSQWHPPTSSSRPTIAPWLYRIATNRALNFIRDQSKRTEVPMGQILDIETLYTVPSHDERTILRDLLTTALKQLSEEEAACLVLHIVSKERYGEIAERLGLSTATVRRRISHGLTTLRTIYQTLDQEVRQ
jgi:RNA polymerase sigma factor (sigma-70 family)